jgi:alkanesulfonate monooxygenase SsuD/methylene tetrahydromethanopterin reductase-like flavin-dependent oxidoreductase (luciferase family)
VAGERVQTAGRYWSAEDLVLMPPPARRIPLMIGSNGPRMLSIALPHVEWWNTWYDRYGNTVEGFAEFNANVSAAAERVGRNPAEIKRSTAVLVELDPQAVKRPHSDRSSAPVGLDGLRAHLARLADAGADEAICILRPIDETSIRAVGALLPLDF